MQGIQWLAQGQQDTQVHVGSNRPWHKIMAKTVRRIVAYLEGDGNTWLNVPCLVLLWFSDIVVLGPLIFLL